MGLFDTMMSLRGTRTIRGTYGASKTPCNVFCYGRWYAVEGSQNVNLAAFEIPELDDGVDVETIEDIDCFTWPDGIDSEEELVDAVDDE